MVVYILSYCYVLQNASFAFYVLYCLQIKKQILLKTNSKNSKIVRMLIPRNRPKFPPKFAERTNKRKQLMFYKVWLIHQLTDPISSDESHIRLLARQSVRQLLSQNSQSVSQSVGHSVNQFLRLDVSTVKR